MCRTEASRPHPQSFRNADENSESARTGNSWSLRWVVKFWQVGTPYLHCVALFASGSLYEPICSGTGYAASPGGVVEQDVQRGAPAGVAPIHSGNRNPSQSPPVSGLRAAKASFVARVTRDRRLWAGRLRPRFDLAW